MLSPNARNFVLEIRGAAVTVTAKLHDACRASASTAVQVTMVEPSGKVDPDAFEQVTGTGSWPPTAVGTVNVNGTAAPSGETSEADAGHDSVGASGVGVGGIGVSDPHAAAPNRAQKTKGRQRLRKAYRGNATSSSGGPRPAAHSRSACRARPRASGRRLPQT